MSGLYKFNNNDTYKIGHLTKGSDPNEPNPKFSRVPESEMIVTGEQLKSDEWRCPTWQEFLNANPRGYSTKKPVVLYKQNKDDGYDFVTEGTIYKKKITNVPGAELSDPPFSTHNQSARSNTGSNKIYEKQLEGVLAEVVAKTKVIQDLEKVIFELKVDVADKEKNLMIMTAKYDALEGLVGGKEGIAAMSDGGGGGFVTKLFENPQAIETAVSLGNMAIDFFKEKMTNRQDSNFGGTSNASAVDPREIEGIEGDELVPEEE